MIPMSYELADVFIKAADGLPSYATREERVLAGFEAVNRELAKQVSPGGSGRNDG